MSPLPFLYLPKIQMNSTKVFLTFFYPKAYRICPKWSRGAQTASKTSLGQICNCLNLIWIKLNQTDKRKRGKSPSGLVSGILAQSHLASPACSLLRALDATGPSPLHAALREKTRRGRWPLTSLARTAVTRLNGKKGCASGESNPRRAAAENERYHCATESVLTDSGCIQVEMCFSGSLNFRCH